MDIGLSIRIDNVSRSGAELFFVQSDGNPKADLEFGDGFVIEENVKSEWREAPIVVGDYGLNAIAYQIKKDEVTDLKLIGNGCKENLNPESIESGKK